MLRDITNILILVVFALSLGSASWAQEDAGAGASSEDSSLPLSDRHRRWLEEEVVHIISNVERQAFEELKTGEDRQRFIDAFWLVRDPTPGTAINEIREEHYKRIKKANRLYGRDTSKPGWKTDRGKMHILFGEPRFRSKLDVDMLVYATELWHYIGVTSYGLPPSFYLVFFRPYDVGEMRLYNPTNDGIQKLFRPLQSLSGMSNEGLTDLLFREVDPELAHAVWSLIPSEGGFVDERFTPNPLASEMLLSRILDSRNHPENYEWVGDFMAFRTAVKVEYTFQHTTPRTLFIWLQNPLGLMELHFAISLRPDQFTLGRYKDKVYGSVTLEGYLISSEDILVAPVRQHSEFEPSPRQVESISHRPFEFQGILPVIPGSFKLSLMWKNEVSRQRIPVLGELDIPNLRELEGPVFSPPIIVRSLRLLDEVEATLSARPFQVGRYLLEPYLGGVVPLGKPFQVFCQLVVPPGQPLAAAEYTLEFQLSGEGEPFLRERKPLADFADSEFLRASIGILQPLSTEGAGSGEHTLRILLLRGEKEVASSVELTFSFSGTDEAGPWIIRRGMPPYSDGYHASSRAEQWMRIGDLDRAREMLSEAVRTEPSLLHARLSLMRLLVKEKKFEEVIALGEPILIEKPRDVQLLLLTASGYLGAGRGRDAVRLLERLLGEEPKSLAALNLLAHANLTEGDLEGALQAAEHSLEIYPNQPGMVELKEKIESMRQ